jgi:protein FrlC
MKLSFHSFGYGSYLPWVPSYTLEEAARRIGAIGYDGIEIGAKRPHAWPPDLDERRRKELKAYVSRCGLEVSAICPSSYNFNLASCIVNEREDSSKYYRDCVQLAADFGAKVVVVVPGWMVFPTSYEQAWEWSKQGLEDAVELAEGTRVTLALEPINSYWVDLVTRTNHALKMMKELNSRSVKVMLDTQHMFLERENPVDAVKKCGDKLVHVHCEDAVSACDKRFVPGEGEFGFESFAKALHDISYKGYLSVEHWGPNIDQIAMKSKEYLGSLIRRLA